MGRDSQSSTARRTRHFTLLVITGAISVLLTAAAAVISPLASGAATAPPAARAAADAPITFSHAVIVDQQRPGNEPDVKTDGNGQIFTSIPFGFSTTSSFVWSSRDAGNSYQLTPGNIGPGKPTTCAGGGDTDLFIDPGNALYFSDLQGLTNISNSMSTDGGATWNTNCAGAPNTPDDRMWFGGTGSSAAGNLTLYQDYDAVASSTSASTIGGNQLVETVSHDGTTFSPVVNSNPSSVDPANSESCAGTGAYDCVTDNEAISGNQVVDPTTGNVFIAHTTIENGNGSGVGVRVAEGKITPGNPTAAAWTDSPNLDAALCPDSTCVDKNGNPEEIAGENFASIARDTAGYLYVTFTAGPLDTNSTDPNFGALTRPEQIYVVHSLQPAGADPSRLTWSSPQPITGTGASAGTNTFPWITAGSDGRVAVAWYHTDETSEQGTCADGSSPCTNYGASSLQNAEWGVQMGESLNAHDASPTYTTVNVTEMPVKHGQICTAGIGCASGGDRSLGDFLQIAPATNGAAMVTYVFDTSRDYSAGEAAGPEAISRQISGPSLFADQGDVSSAGGPSQPLGSVSDPTGDADYSANGSRTPATPNLDLTGASLSNGPNGTLVARIQVRTLSSLAAGSAEGGPDASWIIRWTQIDPRAPGNGHIYYAGMDNNAGTGGSGTPTFFDGDTSGIPAPGNPAEHTKYITYPQTHTLSSSQASYDAGSGTITLRIPRTDVGNPADGTPLYSVTAFTATSTSPQSSTTLFNLIDAATPFDLVVGTPGTIGTLKTVITPVKSVSHTRARRRNASCPVAPGRMTSTSVGPLRLGETQAQARRTYRDWSTHHRRNMDYFCLRPLGIRVGYATHAMVRSLPRSQRARLIGRIVLALTANHQYALRGVRAGEKLSAARRLGLSHPIRIGVNTWYVCSDGRSRGVLKVRGGIIREVGIAVRSLTGSHRAARAFLSSFPES